MKQIILGTAGHIDHGKTSLIKTATGIDTDRLKEEKLRGITIELGFASIKLPSGQLIGIVDVPGHEKFVKNMVAGATGIDIVAMVIAADEGVMPQTKEHMEICSLLDIKYGFVVLTKIDMVDEEWLELVIEDVKDFTKGTFLEDTPIVPVSSVKNKGIDKFINTLDELTSKIPVRSSFGIFRLPVDRVFSMKGFGTVITGTLTAGEIKSGDSITVYPSGVTSKIRGIQVHNQSVEKAVAGMRTAINFQGLDKSSIDRGDVVGFPETLKASYMIDVFMHFLSTNNKPLKNRARIRLHVGTNEVIGNLILLDREEFAPGESAVIQIRLDSPVICVKDDRFVVRSYSPVRTIGGGQILNPIPDKHKRFQKKIVDGLQKIIDAQIDEIILFHVDQSGYAGIALSDLKLMTNVSEKKLDNILKLLLSKREIIQTDKENKIYIHKNRFDDLRDKIADILGNYHKINPLKKGMPKEELKTKLPSVLNVKLFNNLLNYMIKQNSILIEGDTVKLEGHKVALQIDQADVKNKIIDIYLQSGFMPPYFKDLSKKLDIDYTQAKNVLLVLVNEGMIIKVKEELYFHAKVIDELKERLVEFLTAENEISASQFKEMTKASRKYIIPLLEFFDSTNFTIRVGDVRQLRKKFK